MHIKTFTWYGVPEHELSREQLLEVIEQLSTRLQSVEAELFELEKLRFRS